MSSGKKIRIRFWGVRGSIPVSGAEHNRYGGDTSCIEVLSGRERIICDAGTGILALGNEIAGHRKISSTILISHLHWDHISGLSFFKPFYSPKNSFKIIGPRVRDFRKILINAASPPYFPASLKKAAAAIRFRSVSARPFHVGGIRVRPIWLNHPDRALGWRMEFPGGKIFIYISDNEPERDAGRLINWAKGADIMVHDGQYTPSEYREKTGWGHSPYTYPLELAKKAGVKMLILSHFDPSHTDRMLDKLSVKIKKALKKGGSGLKCELARTGKILYL